jgi:DNA recombination protein RmuC
MSLSWFVMGVSVLLVLFAGFALCWQVLRRREALSVLQSCKAQLKQLQTRAYQQEAEIRELTAGLRAEKAHVEQLQRQVEFAQEQTRRI